MPVTAVGVVPEKELTGQSVRQSVGDIGDVGALQCLCHLMSCHAYYINHMT